MNVNKNRLIIGEKLYNESKNTRCLLIICLRQWLLYKQTGDIVFLQRANYATVKRLQESPGAELCLLIIFFNIEMRNYSIAENYMDRLVPHRNYFKNHKPIYYSILLFLQSLFDIRTKDAKKVNKSYKLLDDFSKNQNMHFLKLMLGWLDFELRNTDSAWICFEEAFHKGSRSVFLYMCCFGYLTFGLKVPQNSKLLLSFIKWGMAQELSIDDILEQYSGQIPWKSMGIAEKLYKNNPNIWILKDICETLLENEDYTNEAYQYYKNAEHKQIELDGLSQALVKSAYKNKLEDISRYTMNRFLQSADMDIDLQAYVYHLILTTKKLSDLSAEYANEIIQFSIYCLEHNISGRYYNSIYKYFIESIDAESFESSQKYIAMAEEKILPDLFSYILSSDNERIKHVWIIEKEKREMSVFDISNGEIKIDASGNSFSYICFSAGMRNIIDENLKIIRMVENADINLYSYFFTHGVRNSDILIALARHCLSLEKIDMNWIVALKAILPSVIISYSFKMQIYARLGNYYYENNNLKAALKYYEAVDENHLNDKYIEHMLEVFINAKAFEKATQLIDKKSNCIPDKMLFQALKQIATVEELQPRIVTSVYELLIKSWYDKVFLDIVLKHFKGGQEDWEELCKSLSLMSVFDPELDSAILQNSIWIRKPTVEAQKVLIRIYKSDTKNDLTGTFVYYLIYEIIVNDFKIQYDTIAILEDMYKHFQDRLLAYALSYLYLSHNISTIKSEEILQASLEFMESDNIIFPLFKLNQDKVPQSAYIEKNQAFMYRCLPGKNVFLYYRAVGEEGYCKQRMIYFRFGLYFAVTPHFYGEKLEHYFSEELPTGSITTKTYIKENNYNVLNKSSQDFYFAINNALIYERMFKYDNVEAIITGSLREFKDVKATLL